MQVKTSDTKKKKNQFIPAIVQERGLKLLFCFCSWSQVAGIGAEKPLFSVLATWGTFVNQAVVSFTVAFEVWWPLLGSVQCNWSRTSSN